MSVPPPSVVETGAGTWPTPADAWEATLLIDCDACVMRGRGCDDCVVTVLLGAPDHTLVIDDEERAALEVLARSGLVPPLRLVHAVDSIDPDVPGAAGG
jgi:hypothetical protein